MTLEQHKALKEMQRAASELWAPGRRWTSGEIAWSVLTDPGYLDVIFVGGGWAWRQDDDVSILVDDHNSARSAIEWAGESRIEVCDSDFLLAEEVRKAGYVEDPNAPFCVEVRAPIVDVPTPKVVDGYILRSAHAGDDLLGVHRSSWKPSALPFAGANRPTFAEGATSPLSETMLSAVTANELYRSDLHVVVEAPDSTLAASCIVWLDVRNRAAAIEPLGVVLEHRRLGLAQALSQYAVRAVRHLGGRDVVIHPRGDAAYPAPRGAYLRAGFVMGSRSRVFVRK